MSRIIVSDLPTKISEEKLKKYFSDKGTITDVKLKFKNGEFRRFGFIGFANETEAKAALEYNGTYINHCRISVELCDSNKKKKKKNLSSELIEVTDKISKNQQNDFNAKEEHNNNEFNDNEFKTYLDKDDSFIDLDKKSKKKKKKNKDIVNDEADNEVEDEDQTKENTEDKKLAKDTNISDMDYLKSLKSNKEKDTKKVLTLEEKKALSSWQEFFYVVLRAQQIQRNKKCLTKKGIKDFFRPLKCKSIRIHLRSNGMVANVGFKTEVERTQALLKDNSFIEGVRIKVYKEHTKEDKKGVAPWSAAEERLKGAEPVAESGSIYLRNLWFAVTEDDIQELLSKYGAVSEINLPIDKVTRQNKGFATATFLFPENAVMAMNELDGSDFKGRCLHILPALEHTNEGKDEKTGFKTDKEKKLKASSSSWHNWNTLFLAPTAVIDAIAEKTNLSKQQLLSSDGPTSVAVNMAIGETAIVDEVKKTLEAEGVSLAAFTDPSVQRSKTVILCKNLPASTTTDQLAELFGRYGELGRVILPPSGVTGIIEYLDPGEAKKGFRELAYMRFGSEMLYLEWAPIKVFAKEYDPTTMAVKKTAIKTEENKDTEKSEKTTNIENTVNRNLTPELNTILYVTNLNFETNEDKLKEHFASEGDVCSVLIAKKRGLNAGYGFVQFYKKASAMKALRSLQNSQLQGHNILLKLSEKTTLQNSVKTSRQMHEINDEVSCKLICKNIPFQATIKEIQDLFKQFGDLKSVRIPSKPGTSEHRGFGFLEYSTQQSAKMAFEALSGSTHLYGRRLVLDWAKEDENVQDIRKRTAEQFLASSSYNSSKKAKFDVNQTSGDVKE